MYGNEGYSNLAGRKFASVQIEIAKLQCILDYLNLDYQSDMEEKIFVK